MADTVDPMAIQVPGYRLLEFVGQGAVGKVFRAEQESMEREVALKILHEHLAHIDSVVETYLREAKAVAKLNHPHIVRAFDAGEAGGYYFFNMEFLPGGTLEEYLAQHGPLDEPLALRFIHETASALHHAWERKTIHCDIKPANLMIDAYGQLKLTDLGLAQIGQEAKAATESKRVVKGTPHYLSLEQVRFPDQLDCRTDIYSLGATFYHLASGRTPFQGETNKEIILARLKAEPTPLQSHAPRLSQEFCELIHLMMKPRRSERPQTPEAVMKMVEALDPNAAKGGGGGRASRASRASRVSSRRVQKSESVRATVKSSVSLPRDDQETQAMAPVKSSRRKRAEPAKDDPKTSKRKQATSGDGGGGKGYTRDASATSHAKSAKASHENEPSETRGSGKRSARRGGHAGAEASGRRSSRGSQRDGGRGGRVAGLPLWALGAGVGGLLVVAILVYVLTR